MAVADSCHGALEVRNTVKFTYTQHHSPTINQTHCVPTTSADWVDWIGARPPPLAELQRANRAHAEMLRVLAPRGLTDQEAEAPPEEDETDLPVIQLGETSEPLNTTALAIHYKVTSFFDL